MWYGPMKIPTWEVSFFHFLIFDTEWFSLSVVNQTIYIFVLIHFDVAYWYTEDKHGFCRGWLDRSSGTSSLSLTNQYPPHLHVMCLFQLTFHYMFMPFLFWRLWLTKRLVMKTVVWPFYKWLLNKFFRGNDLFCREKYVFSSFCAHTKGNYNLNYAAIFVSIYCYVLSFINEVTIRKI